MSAVLRFQYWPLPTIEPPLRIGQRNDGAGAKSHPRLLSSKAAPSSVQRSSAPRLGRNNRYL